MSNVEIPCVKCGNIMMPKGPSYVSPLSIYSKDTLQFRCSICGYTWHEPCKDAE